MISDQLKQAIQLIRSGKKIEARQILKRVLINDPTNETAWLWFVDTLSTDEERCIALEGLQKIIPDSKVARIGLAEYRRKEQKKAEHLHLQPSPVAALGQLNAETNPQPEKMVKPDPLPGETLEEMESESASLEEPYRAAVSVVSNEAFFNGQAVTATKKMSAPARFIISAVFALVFVLIVAIFLANFGWAEKYPVLKIFAPASTCSCTDASAYLQRASDRIQRWKTSQALSIFAQVSGKKTVDLDFAKQLYVEEKEENLPPCMKTAHDLTLSLLEYSTLFIEQLQIGNARAAANYKNIVDDYQSQLADEFSRINKGFSCQ